jgi:hypothetical protein
VARAKCAFKESEVTRAAKALKKAGFEIVRVEIEPGKITLFAGKPNDDSQMTNPWDEVLTNAANEKRPS